MLSSVINTGRNSRIFTGDNGSVFAHLSKLECKGVPVYFTPPTFMTSMKIEQIGRENKQPKRILCGVTRTVVIKLFAF